MTERGGVFRPVTAMRLGDWLSGRARFVALSTSSDKLVSENGDSWITALVSLTRAAREFLASAVRSTPNVARHAAKSFFDLADDQIASVI